MHLTLPGIICIEIHPLLGKMEKSMLNHTADIFTNTAKEIFIAVIWDKALDIGHPFCVPKHGSYHLCFTSIISDICIHQKFSKLRYDRREVELQRKKQTLQTN
jgi:hypothetical protein